MADPDLVTFDIFDTLLHRKILAPVDVFELVKLKASESEVALYAHDTVDDFPNLRISAERKARDRRFAEHGGEGEITLDEIYSEFIDISRCTQQTADHLKKIELEVERAILFASPEGKRQFDQHQAAGRKIAFISDMYLPTDFLAETLEKAGFSGAGNLPIFVSGEHRASKHSGRLYNLARGRLDLSADQTWVHIGDNMQADVISAKNHGIQGVHADWSKVDNTYRPAPGVTNSHTVKSIIEFLDTKQAQQYLPTDPLEKIGYSIFGPALFGFTIWLLHKCRELKLNDLLFIARDGWLPKDLFDSCKPFADLADVNTTYFYMSRQTGYRTGIREWDTDSNWLFVTGQIKKTVDRCLKSINLDAREHMCELGAIGLSDLDLLHGPGDQQKLKLAIDTMFSASLRKAQENRQEFQDYYAMAVAGHDRIGVVDIGWGGNIQKSFIHSTADCSLRDRLHGLYFGTLGSSKKMAENGFKLSGWICQTGQPEHWEHLLTNGGVELLEFVMTADHGSTMALRREADGTIVPVLEEIAEDERVYREKAMRVQAGVRRFVDDYRFLLSIYKPESLNSTLWAKPFERLVMDPNPTELEQLASLTHSDAAGANSTRLPLASRQPFKVRFSKGRKRRARAGAFWKAAFDKLNR